MAPYAVRPGSAQPAISAALDYLFSTGVSTPPADEEIPLPAQVDDVQSAPPETDLPDEFEYLFGGDTYPLTAGEMGRSFDGYQLAILDAAPQVRGGTIGAAAAMIAGGYLLASRFHSRERRSQLPLARL